MIEKYLHFCWTRPKGLVLAASVFTLLLALFTFGRLDFDARRESLFKSTVLEETKKLEFESRFGSWKDLTLVIEGSSPQAREKLVHDLEGFLSETPSVSDVRAAIRLPGVEHLGLYFLSVDELQQVDRALVAHLDILAKMSRDGWYGFLESVQVHQSQVTPESEERERLSKVWQQAVDGRGAGALDNLFPRVELPKEVFFIDGPSRHLILLRSEEPILVHNALKQKVAKLHFAGRVVLTGQPLLQAQERRDTIRDACFSTVLAIVVVQLILVQGFRETARPRLAFLSLVFGLFWSMSWAALIVGKLNIITVNFLSIIVGLGVDFSIHILARYTEERRVADSSVIAMTQTLRTTGLENLIGALATSLAFWALVLTDFLAVQQLGMITGIAVPLCFISVVCLLPPLLFAREQRLRSAEIPDEEFHNSPALIRMEQALRKDPRFWLGISVPVLLGLAYLGTSVRFDYNLLNMQSAKSEAVLFEREGGFNSLVAFVVANSPEQARSLKTRLLNLEAVSEVQTVADLLPENIEEKRTLVASIVEHIKKLKEPQFDPKALPDWKRMEPLAKSLESQRQPAAWVSYLKKSGPGPVEDIWRQMQTHLKTELQNLIGTLQHQNVDFDIQKWKKQAPDLQRLSNLDGKTLLRVRAKDSLWRRKVLVEFLDQVESVTDQGMGPPFLIRNYLEQLRSSYFAAVKYAVLAIVILLTLHFRAFIPTFIALVPKMLGAVGMFAAMALGGIDLNPANCMALPLTLGIGLVFGIHAVHRCLEAPDALLTRGATGKAISLSGWTTIASFGTLMSASHPGIYSLGFVMASGVACNMLATYLLVPPLVEIFRNRISTPDR